MGLNSSSPCKQKTTIKTPSAVIEKKPQMAVRASAKEG